LLTEAAEQVMLVWDPHPKGGNPVRGSAIVTPNLAEAAAADPANSSTHRPSGSDPIHRAEAHLPPGADQPDRLAQRLRQVWVVDAVCVTAGAMGAFLASNDGQSHFLPAPAVHSGDPCGAGDRFAASVAVALARGALLTEAVTNGVVDASDWVQAGGAAAFRPTGEPTQAARATAGSVISASSADPSESTGRSESLPALAARLRTAAGGNSTLVATGGCFDIVHAGHVETLQAARRLGDALVVLINSDASVAKLKGPGRPVVNAQDRARVLSAFDCVDAVVEFDDDDPRAPLAALQPDIWVKGGDYGAAELPETETVESTGGRVVLLPYLSGRSTTNIIERSQQDAVRTFSTTPQPAVVGGGVETFERNK
jgi:rfaE bifunctional protein nucleotidyltransferase chain/domain